LCIAGVEVAEVVVAFLDGEASEVFGGGDVPGITSGGSFL